MKRTITPAPGTPHLALEQETEGTDIHTIRVRLTTEQREAIGAAAEAEGLPVSLFMRRAALLLAASRTREATKP